MMRPPLAALVGGLLLCFITAMPAFAYVGPGMGLGAIGVVIGLVMTVALAVVGLLWYPLKRLFKRKPPTGEPPSGGKPG